MSLESEGKGKEMRGCVSLESGIFVADDGTTGRETRGVLRGPRGPKNHSDRKIMKGMCTLSLAQS